jgi:hypothetical protein
MPLSRVTSLIVDMVAYDDASIIQSYYLNRLNDAQNELPFGTLRRYRVPLNQKGARVQQEILSDACMELPRFDYERYNMDGSYRYVYASGINPASAPVFTTRLSSWTSPLRPPRPGISRDVIPVSRFLSGDPGAHLKMTACWFRSFWMQPAALPSCWCWMPNRWASWRVPKCPSLSCLATTATISLADLCQEPEPECPL